MVHSSKANDEQKAPVIVGNMKMWIGTITITSYTKNAGGEAFVASDFGLKKILDVKAQPFVKSSAVGVVAPIYAKSTGKMKLMCTSVANSELGDAAVVASIEMTVYGK